MRRSSALRSSPLLLLLALGCGDGSSSGTPDGAAPKVDDAAPVAEAAPAPSVGAPGADAGADSQAIAHEDAAPGASDAGASGALLVSRTTLSLAAVVGCDPAPLATVTVSNLGSAPTAPLTAALVADSWVNLAAFEMPPSVCLDLPLAPGASCDIGVRYRPLQLGVHSAGLIVQAGAARAAVHIEGRALAPAGLLISPTSLSFGAVKLGALGEPQTVRVTNRGAAGAIRAVSVSGGEFQISQEGCAGATLPPNASCELAVRFAPKTLGVATGTLTVHAGPCAGVSQTALGGEGI